MTANDFLTAFALPHIALTQFKIRRWIKDVEII